MVHRVRERRPGWKLRIYALGMTVVLGVMGILAVLIAVVTPALADMVPEPMGTLIMWLRIPAAAALMTFVWSLTYYILPDVRQRFRLLSPGSSFGVIVWAIASWIFSTYVRHFGNYNAVYGTLAGVIVLLLWIWISALALLAGAEANVLLDQRALEPENKEHAEATPATLMAAAIVGLATLVMGRNRRRNQES
jgi:membrane protein